MLTSYLNKVYQIRRVLFTPLYRNALFLLANSLTTALLGYIFWDIIAHRFSITSVGIATALFSASGLLSTLAHLGFNVGMIRFIPSVNGLAKKLIRWLLSIAGIATIIFSVGYIIIVHLFFSHLNLFSNTIFTLFFIISSAVMAISFLFDSVFIARRVAYYVFIKNTLAAILRIIFPLVFFSSLGGDGIYIGGGLSVFVTMILGLIWWMPRVYPEKTSKETLPRSLIKEISKYSAGNYLSTIFNNLIGYLFPLIILDKIGIKANAYFTIAWLINSSIAFIPLAISSSLLAESSHSEEEIQAHLKKSLFASMLILIPVLIFFYVFAHWILLLFGVQYASKGTVLLQIILPSNLAISINILYATINQIHKKTFLVFIQSLFMFLITIGLISIFLYSGKEVNELGISYTISSFLVAFAVIFPLLKATFHKTNHK